jgi:DNA-binding PadR family transcriptional regulator
VTTHDRDTLVLHFARKRCGCYSPVELRQSIDRAGHFIPPSLVEPALKRLVKRGKLRRLANGRYDRVVDGFCETWDVEAEQMRILRSLDKSLEAA